ncbi:hypothetical protein AB0F17_62060 [Nonomuraea sp. NPDC026600]|uniref:hypothetical protein n=1 Tax=Nonomuraea sp. NPDC026600 TaxID=3155363 RepID=UPI0033D3CAED
MHQFTNLPNPASPFPAGLARLTRRRIAAVTVLWATGEKPALPAAYAVIYLPCNRIHTPPMTLGQPIEFDFRTVTANIDDPSDVAEVAAMFTRDKTRAHQRADILAGYDLFEDLIRMGKAAPEISDEVTALTPLGRDSRRRARLVNAAGDQKPSTADLHQLCKVWGIRLESAPHGLADDATIADRIAALPDPASACWLAIAATERALAIALVTSRRYGRYTLDGEADVAAALASHQGHLPLPQHPTDRPVSRPTTGVEHETAE